MLHIVLANSPLSVQRVKINDLSYTVNINAETELVFLILIGEFVNSSLMFFYYA